jgi:predicted amidohydrolase
MVVARSFLTLILMLAWLSLGFAEQKSRPARTVRVCAVCQSWSDKERNLAHVLAMLDAAAAQRAELVCLPQECVPTDGGADAKTALETIAKTAAGRKLYVAANLKERDAGKVYLTSYLIGPDGRVLGKYRKSHRMPDEPIAVGDCLPVFDTPLGKIGLIIGSDNLWPEVPLVMALNGAELILWSDGVDAVPQSHTRDIISRVRALDDHVTLVAAGYAAEIPYLCSNYPNYTGSPLGHGCVVDRSGTIVADTGPRPGVAVSPIDPACGKDIYFLTFKEDRKLFHYLTDKGLKPAAPQGKKRKIKVAIAQVGFGNGPNPDPNSGFAKILDAAGSRGCDVIVMTEFGFPTETDAARKTFAMVADKARKYRSYVIIGGLGDPAIPNKEGRPTSWAYLWDRDGKVVGKYRISQYGLSRELPVFQTDFGVIGIILCGDIYSQEISRAMTLQGAEIIFCPSQSWGPSGQINQWMQQARAIDNCVTMVPVHLPMSDVTQRSYVIDPYGYPLAATDYWAEGVATAEVDLDAGRTWFARSDKPGAAGRRGYLAGYYPKTVPEKRTDLRAVLLAGRRPELYGAIVEKTLAERQIPEDVWQKMSEPQ